MMSNIMFNKITKQQFAKLIEQHFSYFSGIDICVMNQKSGGWLPVENPQSQIQIYDKFLTENEIEYQMSTMGYWFDTTDQTNKMLLVYAFKHRRDQILFHLQFPHFKFDAQKRINTD